MAKPKMVPDAAITIRLKQGVSQSGIAREFGVSRQAISDRVKRREKMEHPISSVRRFTVVFLRHLGFTLKEITYFTEYTGTHVRQILKAHGIVSTDTNYEYMPPKEIKRDHTPCECVD